MIADNASGFQDVDFLKASLTNFSDSATLDRAWSHIFVTPSTWKLLADNSSMEELKAILGGVNSGLAWVGPPHRQPKIYMLLAAWPLLRVRSPPIVPPLCAASA